MISRRRFLVSVTASFVAPLVATAQAMDKGHRIGFLGGGSASGYARLTDALRLGLRDHGYVEGKNITIEYRWAEGKYERLPALAAELIRLRPDIIITQGTPAAQAAKEATATVPIVMAIVGDPVDTGIVTSLARPGRNITGSSFFMGELNAKRLELMKTLRPGLQRMGLLMNPDNAVMATVVRDMTERARALNVTLQIVNVRRVDELDEAVGLAKARIEALTVPEDGLFIANAKRVAELALRSRLPTIGFREYCEDGGLLAYGVDFPYIWRQSAALVDKILKGVKPADLPIEQATKFDFIVNRKTARALGLPIPSSLLLRADQVIE